MKYIIDFVDLIVSYLTFVWEFFTNFLTNILKLIKYLDIAVDTCSNLILELPGWIQAFAYMSVIVMILYQVLGRTAGGQGDSAKKGSGGKE